MLGLKSILASLHFPWGNGYISTMSYDHFRPPEHFSPSGKMVFRALCWVTFIIAMALFSYFILPLVYRYVSLPLGDWGYEVVRSWTGEPYKPR
jgi:hypothetical protein